jgi:WD40 repeat protein/serine/threonine protein kinase
MSHGVTNEHDDGVAEQAASFDEALAAGRDPVLVPAEDPEGLSALLAAQASLRLLERVWPRSLKIEHSEPESPSPATAVFGRFQIIRELGRGGFGLVFLAVDPVLRRPVALKVPRGEVLLDPESRKRFVREARAVANLDHSNIVPLYEAGEVGPICYLASAYCEGPTLAAWLRSRRDPVPPRLAAQILAPLADAMEHAHERGVLHRDLKPSNVLLHHPRPDGPGADPATPRDLRSSTGPDQETRAEREPQPATGDEPEFIARIIDFGLARLMDRGNEEATASLAAMGSAPYMAPEQVEGNKVGPATDVYGLGTILYSLLCLRPPHRGTNAPDTLRRVVADAPVPPRRGRSEIPRDLEAICLKCLEKDPARRYRSARDLADDVGRFLAGEPTNARPRGHWEKLNRTARRHPAALFVLAVVAACATILLVGRSRYEARLEATRRLARQKDNEARAQESQKQRHLQYLRDIRRAEELIRAARAPQAQQILMQHQPRPEEDDLRDFAWHHLLRRCHTERHTLTGHRGEVYYLEFSPRGDLLACAGEDGFVRIWNTGSWRLAGSIKASETEVNVAAFSPDGNTLATVDDEGKLKLWEIATGRSRWEKLAHEGDAVIARFTPDGKKIITGGRKDGFLRIWDRASGSMLDAFHATDPFLENAVFSPDGSKLATASRDGVKLWNWSRRTLIASLPDSEGAQGLAFSHDGSKLASGHEREGLVQLWEVSSRRLLRVFHRFRGNIGCPSTGGVFVVAFFADDRAIVTAGDDGTIRFWDVASGMARGVHQGHTGRIWNLALSPDGRTIASAGRDKTVRLWDAEPCEHVKLPVAETFQIAFSADDQSLLTLEIEPAPISWPNYPIFVGRWDSRSGSRLKRTRLDRDGILISAAFSRDGRALAIESPRDTITLWDVATGHRQRIPSPLEGSFVREFSPDSHRLLLSDPEQWSFLDIDTGRRISLPWRKLTTALFTPTGAILALHPDGSAFEWEPSNGQIRQFTTNHTYFRGWMAISGDGGALASVSPSSPVIRLLSTETFELKAELPGHPAGTGGMAFAPDGKTLASAGAEHTVKLWHVATGEEQLTLGGFSGTIWTLLFSPDGRTLATLSSTPQDGNEVFLWQTAAVVP